jgi:tetratricopeptide (TPR) repeat protein
MEEIVQEALTKGVEMHIAGEFEMASQLYGSVLKLRPNHADANHNMGLLKADAGHDLDALPYLQTALEADTSISQFWLSYAKVLSKLNRVDEANRILSLAKESGADGAEFLELQRQLNEPALVNALHKSGEGENNAEKPNILDTFKLSKALKLAKKKLKESA